MVENVKLRQINFGENLTSVEKDEASSFFSLKPYSFWEEDFSNKILHTVAMRSGCHGNTFVRVTSKSTNLAKITLLVSHDNSDKIY